MSEKKSDNVKLYRIIHIDNLEYILSNGMQVKSHVLADPKYISIGDNNLIIQRNIYQVKINPPNGLLGDYVPFYFGPLSPMLLNIKTGYRGITKRSQEDIVYIICNLNQIIIECEEWCFTDGHGKDMLTNFFNDIDYLNEIHWNTVGLRYWQPIENYLDRQVRKQAEFLVKNQVPVSCIDTIVVFNEEKKNLVEETINKLNLKIQVLVNPENQFYY